MLYNKVRYAHSASEKPTFLGVHFQWHGSFIPLHRAAVSKPHNKTWAPHKPEMLELQERVYKWHNRAVGDPTTW